MYPQTIVKRDGHTVPFDPMRIASAIDRCYKGIGRTSYVSSETLANRVINVISARDTIPTVEQVQDAVIFVLNSESDYAASDAYLLYRTEHAKERNERPIPQDVVNAFESSEQYFPTQLQQFQFYDKYSRFDYNLGRRETWEETVARVMDYLKELSRNQLSDHDYGRLHRGILDMRVMPSMRLLAMAGDAARRNNITIYNCSYLPIDRVEAFEEALLISMNGCGVGYSVERQYVESFPRIQRQNGRTPERFVVEDTTEGWGRAVTHSLHTWFSGGDIAFDFSELRPAGAPLRVKGGRSSGPEPLRRMLAFARSRILARQGSYLRPLDAHDLVCAVGNAAVSGGMRRTAMISLFDFDEAEMLHCKDGNFELENSQRWNANNSAVWPEQGISEIQFLTQFTDMVKGERGEPGIFNRQAALALRPSRRDAAVFGTNPCGEINLRPWEFCNLSIAVARSGDRKEELMEKVALATIIGTIQSMATYFPGLNPNWEKNAIEERLLGVDITGQRDCPALESASLMRDLRDHAIETNLRASAQLGINQSVAITTVKPNGNSSQLLDTASGLHARWAKFYERNVRVSAHSPIYKVLRDAGVPMDPENGQQPETAESWVVHFVVRAPEGATTRHDLSAIDQCRYWLLNKKNWTEHNPSVTITYQLEEIIDLARWVWHNKDFIGGMAFLPSFDAQYDQLPYIDITEEEYEKRAAEFPIIDFSKLFRYEATDLTTASQELACQAGYCETDVVDFMNNMVGVA